MFDSTISLISTFSIVVAAVLGVIRFNVIEKSYYPFIYICWLGLAIEIFAYFFQAHTGSLLPSNIYVLLEGLLYTWQFKKWGSFKRRPFMFFVIQASIAAAWIIDGLYYHNIHRLSSSYRIFYSIILVILAIDHINKLIVRERKSFLKNAKFLICIAVIVFFSYKMITEIFFQNVGSSKYSNEFLRSLFHVQKYVNLFVNLLFAYVVIWIPKKKIFLERLK